VSRISLVLREPARRERPWPSVPGVSSRPQEGKLGWPRVKAEGSGAYTEGERGGRRRRQEVTVYNCFFVCVCFDSCNQRQPVLLALWRGMDSDPTYGCPQASKLRDADAAATLCINLYYTLHVHTVAVGVAYYMKWFIQWGGQRFQRTDRVQMPSASRCCRCCYRAPRRQQLQPRPGTAAMSLHHA